MIDHIGQELRYALRALVRRPGLTVAAVVTLALGIGANTAVFSLVNSILLRPLPYAAPERLVALWPEHFLANREIEFLRNTLRHTEAVASVSPGWLMALTGVDSPTELNGARVSGNLFELLGVRAALGRTFDLAAERPGAGNQVVLSHALWQSQFGGDPNIIGRSIVLDQTPYVVIGVMPKGFHITDSETDLWYPLPMDPNTQWYTGAIALALGRLRPGTSVGQADLEFRAVAARMGSTFSQPREYARDARSASLTESMIGPLRPTLALLLGAALFIVLIATVNVAHLLLVRATDRRTELAVRSALGASRRALLAPVMAEAFLVALAGGVAGIVLGAAALPLLRQMLPPDTPRLVEIGLHSEVLWFSALITLAAAVLVALGPAALTAARRLAPQLRAGGRTTTAAATAARGPLIATEVALAVVLLCGALLMLRTIARLYARDPGFRREQVLTLRVQPSFASSQDEVRAYWRTLLPRLAALPGVAAVGTVLHLPMSGRKWNANVELEGEPLAPGATPPRTAWQAIGGDYFGAMTIPLERGRVFTDADREGADPVVIVNEAFVQQILSGRDPIGRRIKAGNATSNQWVTIVGQVGAVRHDSLSGEPTPELYAPLAQKVIYATFIAVRTRPGVDPRRLAPLVRSTIWSVHRDVPISLVRTMDDVVVASTMKRRLVMNLLVGYALLGLLLAAVGIYGLVAYSVRQRTREIGIRLALGAQPTQVTRLIAASGLRWASIGIMIGLPLALALSRFLQGIIFGIAERDALSFTAAPVALLGIALAAAYVPARRAAATSPAIVLQE